MKIFEYDDLNFVLDDETLQDYVFDSYEYFRKKKGKIYEYFEITNFRKVTINLFINRNKFEEHILSFYEDKTKKIPSSCKGTFNGGMINVFIDKQILFNKNDKKYYGNLPTITHEYIHLIYKECIKEKYKLDRLIWLDEGLANYLSDAMDAKNFKLKSSLKYTLIELLGENYDIDKFDINQLNFNTTNFNTLYVFSYAMIKCMFDTNKVNILKQIMKTNNLTLYKNIFKETCNYYL